ncbi:Aspartate--tRNA ligase [Gossypium arboreum]|uniref:Aspartate--tRNA ligase n=1 Tax=Gossypium arboreum TaxID=29729 RepID=A0A0B0PFX4_GOSAR|nr:Aspartate--tRNA ligase [Gossypium arboreum]
MIYSLEIPYSPSISTKQRGINGKFTRFYGSVGLLYGGGGRGGRGGRAWEPFVGARSAAVLVYSRNLWGFWCFLLLGLFGSFRVWAIRFRFWAGI